MYLDIECFLLPISNYYVLPFPLEVVFFHDAVNLTYNCFEVTKCPVMKHLSSLLQVCGEQSGDACGWRLPDHLHERSHSSGEDARDQLAQEMLPDDWQKVRKKKHYSHIDLHPAYKTFLDTELHNN